MPGDKGYKLSRRESNVRELPISEISLAPFNDKTLNNLVRKIKPSDDALLLNPLRLSIYYLNTKKSRKRSIRSIARDIRFLEKIVLFLNSQNDLKHRTSDKALFTSDLKQWLIEQEMSESSITNCLNQFNSWIKFGCGLTDANHLKDSLVIELKRKAKFITQDYDDIPTLQMLFPNLNIEARDDELLVGLKESMLWLLNEFQQIRDAVNENLPNSLRAYYDNLKMQKKSPTKIEDSFFRGETRKKKDSHLIVDLINTVLSLNSEVANEFMFVELIGSKMFKQEYIEANKPFTSDEILNVFERQQRNFNDKLDLEGKPIEHIKEEYYGPVKRLYGKSLCKFYFPSLSFPVYPTTEEVVAMEWLLASDRIQRTGLDTLNINKNVLHDTNKKTFQLVEIVKHRMKESQKTDIYHNDNMYNAHLKWVELIKNAKQYIEDVNDQYIPPIPVPHKKKSNNGMKKSLWLMCLDGTYTNKRLKEDIKGSINEKHIINFLSLLKTNLMQAIEKKTRQEGEDRKKHFICARTIAQTRANIDNDIMTGRLVGHNKETHENIYRNRTRSSLVNDESATWAADIGNAMKDEAEKLMNNSEFVSVKEIRKILHISDITNIDDIKEIQSIIVAAENDEYIAELTTELKKNGKTYIMVTPWTAALIKGQIRHIDSELNSIEFNNQQKRLQIQTRQMYLSLLLERFPKKTLTQADNILDEYDFPYPRMV